MCESKRVERLNPKTKKKMNRNKKRKETPTKWCCCLSPEDEAREKKNEKERKKKTNEIKSTKHAYTQTEWEMRNEEERKQLFFWFFKSLQKSRRYKKEWNTRARTHTRNVLFIFFC